MKRRCLLILLICLALTLHAGAFAEDPVVNSHEEAMQFNFNDTDEESIVITPVRDLVNENTARLIVRFNDRREIRLLVDGEVYADALDAEGEMEIIGLSEGVHVITARYVDDETEYECEPATITVDMTPPGVSLSGDRVTDMDDGVVLSVTEPAHVVILNGRDILGDMFVEDEAAFENLALEPGMELQIVAMDEAGNSGEMVELTVERAPRALLALDYPAQGAECDEYETLTVSGRVYVISMDSTMNLALDGYAPLLAEPLGAAPLPEGDSGDDIGAVAYIPFEIDIDVSDLPVDEMYELQFLIDVNGEPQDVEEFSSDFMLVMPRAEIFRRAALLAAAMAGVAVAILMIISVNRRIKRMRDGAR